MRIGFYVTPEKYEKLGWEDFEKLAPKVTGGTLFAIDPDVPLESQGPFCAVILKVTELLATRSEDPVAEERLSNFEAFFLHHPDVLVVDPIESQERLMNRGEMSRIIASVGSCLPLQLKISFPDFVEVYNWQESSSMLDKLRFPVMCKNLVAGGVDDAHRMHVVFNRQDLPKLACPAVVQNYINHDAVLFKVFAIGDFLKVVWRPSLPNLVTSRRDLPPLIWENQRPMSQLDQWPSEALSPSSTSCTGPVQVDMPLAAVQVIAAALRRTANLTLFGFDVVREVGTGHLYVIDLNYFPSYRGCLLGGEHFFQVLLPQLCAPFQSKL